jgi:hypothetical protein
VSYLAIREKRIRKMSRFHPRPLGRSARQDAHLSLSLKLQGRREPAQTRTPGADPGHPPQPAPAEPRFFLFEDKPIAERRARSARAPRSARQHLNPAPGNASRAGFPSRRKPPRATSATACPHARTKLLALRITVEIPPCMEPFHCVEKKHSPHVRKHHAMQMHHGN